jgi:P27 family predicted phage terminase small subunit
MTTRGRKPVPTQLKVVRGNPGKRALHVEDEPKTPVLDDDADIPAFLSESAREHWGVVSEQLREAKLLGRVDSHALGLYCEAFARYVSANAHIAKHGPVVVSPRSGYPVQSPYLAIANKAHEQMCKLLIEFGMTPSSRSRVSKVDNNEADPYAAFVKTPRSKGG